MSDGCTILLLEDEPLILMDLEFAVEDLGCKAVCATCCEEALKAIAVPSQIHAAVLDVSLKNGETCEAVALELDRLGVPYLLHSGDLDRRNETVRRLNAMLVPKPSSADRVIAAVMRLAEEKLTVGGVPWRRPGPAATGAHGSL